MRKLDMKTIQIDDPIKNASELRTETAISDEEVNNVKGIMNTVMQNGDNALLEYTSKFDGVKLTLGSIRVSNAEIKNAYASVDKEQLKALKEIKRRIQLAENTIIKKFTNIQVKIDGIRIRKSLKPIESVGCYVPGGQARYPSTVLMVAVPAVVACVKRIVICSPPTKSGTLDPLTLVAADLCRIKEIYKVGGAWSIAALAYGTETIKPVSKLVGPGGHFVTIAKALASSRVSIDMLAGPTELLVFADQGASTRKIALDIISQAEHSSDTFCGLVTTSRKLADDVVAELSNMFDRVERGDIVRESLERKGFVALCRNNKDAINFINQFAPEHLQIITKDARKVSKKVQSAGLILVGEDTPSAASDYALGSNHVLPTLAFARSRASLSCLDFVKLVSVVESSRKGLKKIAKTVKLLSEAEGLPNHYAAVMERINE